MVVWAAEVRAPLWGAEVKTQVAVQRQNVFKGLVRLKNNGALGLPLLRQLPLVLVKSKMAALGHGGFGGPLGGVTEVRGQAGHARGMAQ